MDTRSTIRCNRNSGRENRRCREAASPGKQHCERHLRFAVEKGKKKKLKRKLNNDSEDFGEFSGNRKRDVSESKKRREKEAGTSEDELVLTEILVREQKKQFSLFKRERVIGDGYNNVTGGGIGIVDSGKGLRERKKPVVVKGARSGGRLKRKLQIHETQRFGNGVSDTKLFGARSGGRLKRKLQIHDTQRFGNGVSDTKFPVSITV